MNLVYKHPVLPSSAQLAAWIRQCAACPFGGEIILGLLPNEHLTPNSSLLLRARLDAGLAPEFFVKSVLVKALARLSQLPNLALATTPLENGRRIVRLQVGYCSEAIELVNGNA